MNWNTMNKIYRYVIAFLSDALCWAKLTTLRVKVVVATKAAVSMNMFLWKTILFSLASVTLFMGELALLRTFFIPNMKKAPIRNMIACSISLVNTDTVVP